MSNQKVWTRHFAGILLALAGSHVPNYAVGAELSGLSIPKEPASSQAPVAEAYRKLPLRFEANAGQTNSQVKFLSRGHGYTLFLTSTEAVLALRKSGPKPAATNWLRMKLMGANPRAEITGSRESPGTVNYFIGDDPKKWRTNVPTFGKVEYRDIYPGVDLIYYGNQQQLEYDLVVAPGADAGAARLLIQGARRIQLDSGGDLLLDTAAGTVRFRKPAAYQETATGRQWIETKYKLRGAGQVAFQIAAYDHSRPLIIDPVLIYSSYLGGSASENFYASVGYYAGIAADSSGSAYVTGYTNSIDFPTVNPYQPSYGGNTDVFVTKFTPDGSALVYSTYLGGSGAEYGGGIAVDSLGNAYVAGQTNSTNFPTTTGAFTTIKPGPNPSVFVTKLNSTGSGLLYSTYLGGKLTDIATAIAVDSSFRASVTGQVDSLNFPTTAGAPQSAPASNPGDAFVTTLAADGSSLVFSTYLGGANLASSGEGIAVDSAGNVYVTGRTASSSFPVVNPLQATLKGSTNAFVAKLNPAASTVAYSTYLGGSSTDFGFGIAVDSVGSAYVTGTTYSNDFPTANPYQAALLGPTGASAGAFVSKLNPAGSVLVYSTYLGGGASINSHIDQGLGIAVDSTGAAYVAGETFSGNFPLVGSLDPNTGVNIPFLTKFNPAGSALVYSTLLGGQGAATAVAVDTADNAYVTGEVISTSGFPTTPGAAEPALPPGTGFVSPAFAVKIASAGSTTALQSSVNPSVFGQQVTFTATVTPSAASSNTPTGTLVFEDAGTPVFIASLTNGTATFTTSGLSVGSHSITAAYGGDMNFAASASTPLPQIVNMAATATTLMSSLNPANAGQAVTFTATVAPLAPGAGTPTGTVTFLDGATALGTGPVSSGVATVSTSTLSVGSHTITASYGGDLDFAASASVGFTETIAGVGPVVITVTESINVGDVPVLSQGPGPIAITVTEAIKVTDVPVLSEGPAPIAITVTEAIKITDVPVLSEGPAPIAITVTEAIKVTDVPVLSDANIPTGTDVTAQPLDSATGTTPVTLTFSTVTQAGVVNLTTSATGPPPPSGFQLGNPALYYDLTTTAGFTGTITICINYTGISFQTPPGPRLFHFESGSWMDRTTTVNTSTRTVCGAVSSLSPFGLFQASSAPPIPVTTSFSTTPSALNVQYVQGTQPSSFTQTFSVTSIPAGVPFTVVSSASWLVAPAGSSTAATFAVTLNLAGFTAGNYAATLNVSSANGSVQVPVSLTVLPLPALSSQPAASQLMGTFGTTIVTQDIQLMSTSAGVAFTAAGNVPWLTLSASGGTTPATLHLQANPAGLPTATYQGTITVTASAAANSPYSIPVSFVVGGTGGAGQSAVDNSASFGSALAAPNSILTLFGAVGCNSNPQVLVNGIASQILFAGATQINFVVPGPPGVLTGTTIQAVCNGAVMETASVEAAPVDPAIFTQTASGNGPGSIENQDGSVNSAGNPALRDGYISVYVTGFGIFNPPSPDGLQRLANSVTATIGGVSANVVYAGEAPTETSGLQQINIQIPAKAPVGPSVPIVLEVAGFNTQAGVTVAIQ